MDDRHQQYSSMTSAHRPQHLQAAVDGSNNAYSHESKRRPLVLAAAASPTEGLGASSSNQQQRKLRFAQQPTTPAAPLHNLRDWMHLPTPSTAAKSSGGSNRSSDFDYGGGRQRQYASANSNHNSHRPS